MPAQWTSDLVGKMHKYRISKTMLAAHMGLSREYVSMVLNGRRDPPGAEAKFRAALASLIAANSDASAS